MTKRNYIKLFKEEKDGKTIYETYFTPTQIPFRKIVDATMIMNSKDEEEQDDNKMILEMVDFVVDIYGGQFTKDDVLDRLHAPDAIEELESQVKFIMRGQMDDERKKELAKMV